MSTNKKCSTGEAILMCIAVILSICGVALAIRGAIIGRAPLIRTIGILAGFILVIFYLFYGYQKPHGNLLRYVMLGFACLLILTSLTEYTRGMNNIANAIVNGTPIRRGGAYYTAAALNASKAIQAAATSLSIMLVAYIAGRLNKFKQNQVLFVIVFILLIVRALSFVKATPIMISQISEIVMWFTLALSYFFRYKQHKAAGLAQDDEE